MLLVSPKYVHDDKPSKSYITQYRPSIRPFLFEVIRRNSSTTPPEGPNILLSFFNADISRCTATGEVDRLKNLKSQPLVYITETSINFAQLIVDVTFVVRPQKG